MREAPPPIDIFEEYGDLFSTACREAFDLISLRSGGRRAPYAQYAGRPLEFMREVLGVKPWEKQRLIVEAFTQHDRLAVKSSPGVGKSWLGAALALYWNQCITDGIVVSTAGTWEQVEMLLWREIHGMWGRAILPLKGKLSATRIDCGPNHYATGISTNDENNFRGKHAPGGVLAILDEAHGVRPEIHAVVGDILTGANCKLLELGNPVSRTHPFFEAFRKPGWWTGSIRADDVPDPPPAPGMVNRAWIEQVKVDLGPGYETNPLYQYKVLAEFPTESDYQLVSMAVLEAAADREPGHGGRHMGVDIARFGSDKCVAVALIDGRVRAIDSWGKTDTMATAGKIKKLAEGWQIEGRNVHVDVSGVGGGVVDRLREIGLAVDPVDFGSQPRGDWDDVIGRSVRFLNRRAELHWTARRLLEEGGLAIPAKYAMLWSDLMALEVDYSSREMVAIEPKESVRARIGRSPDFSDALVIALSRGKPAKRFLRVPSAIR